MGGWNGVYTKNGLALLAKLTQGSTLEITRAVTGTGIVSDDLLINQTAVTGIKQTMNFQPVTYPEAGTCKLPMFVKNEGVGAGYTVHQIGLYATDPDVGEILYFIAQSSNGTDVPSATEVTGYVGTWTFYFQYGQADNVTVYVDPSNAVTVDMLEEVRVLAMRGVSTPKIGNPIAFNDSANLPFAGLSVYGRSTQAGTPTPDQPVSIDSVGSDGEIKLTVTSKNLLEATAAATTGSGDEYETYDEKTITLSTPNGLRGIPVTTGGNFTDTTGQQWICDEIDLVRGVYIQRIGKYAFTGEESGWRSGAFSTDETMTYVFLADATIKNVALSWCTHASFSHDTARWNNGQYMRSGGGLWQTLTEMTLDAWMAYLADQNEKGTPVTVYYPLDAPVETTLHVDTLRSYNPNTTVFNTSGADMLADAIRDVNENAFGIVLNQARSYPEATTITVADGGEYRYENAITALTVNYPVGTFECWIKFLTGSTFTLTLPSETTYIGSIPDFAASTWYELSIKDGVAIFGEVGAGE